MLKAYGVVKMLAEAKDRGRWREEEVILRKRKRERKADSRGDG